MKWFLKIPQIESTFHLTKLVKVSSPISPFIRPDIKMLWAGFQTVLGTVISAMTGSEDPAEVATMAKQATEVSSNSSGSS